MQIHDMQKLFALNFEFAPMVLIYRQTCIKPHLYIYHIECLIYSHVVHSFLTQELGVIEKLGLIY